MKKFIPLFALCLLLTVCIPASARNAIGLSLDSVGIYPMGLMELDNGYVIGLEAYPGLSYIGIIGRHYEYKNFLGAYGGLVVGSASSKYATSGLNLLRLQGGYSFRLEKNGRVALGLSYDTFLNDRSNLALIVELHYLL